MDDVYENINDYNPSRKRKTLIVFGCMIADIKSNKTFQAIMEKLFIRFRKLNLSVFLNWIHCLIKKINNSKNLYNIAINHSADIDYKDFMKIYWECTRRLYSCLTIDTTLPSYPLRFRKNLLPTFKNDSNWSD